MRFAWHGPADGSGAIYYRIQGPTLLIEFSAQGALGAAGGHYHSIYRNPTNEYGRGPPPAPAADPTPRREAATVTTYLQVAVEPRAGFPVPSRRDRYQCIP